ncbi:glycosyltransferase involved in cell wall biosynthesis [Thermocatellispora tengchongensis]|uniref:Glycosyltransferase involved in cell wall biosynthesis n=1 Tax=Thermocatellispora tengchongensis TaxID=1073253 RepID=A0A840PL15_9ACTN|nr:glycosyltransferase [Thermocatellispora tengchongensis]MBB5138310.1 glycosyltransferase involved in cell wall biosynthesis [Thermocatellispora tengchongensis]
MVLPLPTEAARLDAAPAPAAERPRRVMIATDTYPPDVNGAAYFTHRLATGLAARGNDVHVVCASDDGKARTERVEGVLVHRLRSARLMVHPTMRVSVPTRLDVYVSAIAPDVVHTQGHFVVGRAAVAAARRAGVPVVATNHFMPDNLFQFAHIPARLRAKAGDLAWRDFRRIFSRADHVTTPTRIAAGLLAEKGFAREVEAVSCGIDLSRFHPFAEPKAWARKLFDLPDRPTVLFVGRLDEEKRLDEPIRALPHVLNTTDAQLALVGSGSKREELERLAHRIGVGDRVRFLGFVPDEALPQAYAAADLFCMPGVAELQSIATLEAMASGLPVVAADAMALPHLVHPGENGHLYRPGDVLSLARHLTEILTSDDGRARMGAASREIALTHDHQASLARFEAIYAELAR